MNFLNNKVSRSTWNESKEVIEVNLGRGEFHRKDPQGESADST